MEKIAVLLTVIFCTLVAANESYDDIIQEINSKQTTWKAGHNKISRQGVEYLKRLSGTKFPEENENIQNTKDVVIAENIPQSFDARLQWPKCDSIASIKNQGRCGSCWAVAAAAVASDRLCIKSGFKVRVNISAENLLSCCSACSDDGGCNGGYPAKAWAYLKHTGLVTGGDYESNEGCQPYQIEPSSNYYTPPCKKKCTNTKFGHSFQKDKHYGKTSYYLPEDVAAIQTDILNNGPVEAAFEVYKDFMYYISGVYTQTSSEYMGGHAVRLIGWGVQKGVKYWLVANSWGRDWGENGTFKIKRGTNECKIEEFITAGLMKK